MKSVLCLLAILFASACVDCQSREDFRKAIDECRNEVGITKDLRKLPRDDPKAKCMHACIMKKMGKMENGKVLPGKAFEMLQQRNPKVDESLREKFNECAEKANEESDECEVAGVFAKCIFESIAPLRRRKQQPMAPNLSRQ